MSSAHFLRLATIAGSGKLIAAFRHNKREIQKELGSVGHINPALSQFNYSLHGLLTSKLLSEQHKDKIKAAGIERPRKNAALAIEIIFSFPPNTNIPHRGYFTDCVTWAAEQFGADNLLSADVHPDEAAPHCHVLLIPLLDGRLRGRDLMGDMKAMFERQADFFEKVSKRYGFTKPTKLSHQNKQSACKTVLERLRVIDDPCLKSAAWAHLRDDIGRNPLSWLQALGVSFEPEKPKRKLKTTAQIFTSKGKGGNTEKAGSEKRYIAVQPQKEHNRYALLAVSPKQSNLETIEPEINTANEPAVINPPVKQAGKQNSANVSKLSKRTMSHSVTQCLANNKVPESAEAKFPDVANGFPDFETVRVRDSEQSADRFNPETGEFIKPLQAVRNNRAAANALVNRFVQRKGYG